ncbi:universal stress protein [Pelagicoccus sp. SDUM812002]|uniref:universal stress protein n=1 Tax=Pelagicoccus sp. SDUM812002 TaxID=3041266 RepID=UPI0034E2CAAA
MLDIAQNRNASLIVMGSKGKCAIAATILGSTFENRAKAPQHAAINLKLWP